MEKYKILLLTNSIPNYRKKLYELLGERFDLTVAHFGSTNESELFTEVIVKTKKKGAFYYLVTTPDYNSYDVVVVWGALKFFELFKLVFKKKRNFKLILFGPGVSSSYTKKYDSDWKISFLYTILLKKIDAAIFYDNYPFIKYSAKSVDSGKLFVAPNTVCVDPNLITKKKHRDSYLFIGTLYKEKEVLTLLKAYKLLSEKYGDRTPELNIIGDGPEKDFLEKWTEKNSLNKTVKFHGRITGEKKLAPFFQKSLACISPNQAGLSVLESLAYGVPYVTTKYPVTGGEFTAVMDGVTGFTFNGTASDLENVLREIYETDSLDTIIMNCHEFYNRFRSPEIWVNNFSKAIHYAIGNMVQK